MKKYMLSIVATTLATLAFSQEATKSAPAAPVTSPQDSAPAVALTSAETTPWRLSVGVARLFGVESSFTLDPTPAIRALPRIRLGGGGRSKAEATSATANFVDGVLVFDNGFIDTEDSAGFPGETWNWRIDDAASFTASGALKFRNEFTETTGLRETQNGLSNGSECDLDGITVDLSYTLLSRDRFGLDLSVGLTWYEDEDCLDAAGRVYSRSASERSGTVEHSMDASYLIGEPDLVNPDGSIGAGTFEGPGPILDFGSTEALLQTDTVIQEGARRTLASDTLFMRANGEYTRRDLRVALEPYYSPCEAMTLRGIFGVAVVDSEFSVDATAMANGKAIWHQNEKFDDTAVCAIVGAEVSWNAWRSLFLSAGIESYLGLDDLAIQNEFIRGEISQGDYQVHVAMGVCF